jgi:ribosome-binding protein aMBF1 (putative translation factor)
VGHIPPLLISKKTNFALLIFEMQSDHKEMLLRFGRHLESMRKKQNLSLRKLALNCNIDHADVKKYENGEYNLTLVSLTELAKGLDIPLKELMDF